MPGAAVKSIVFYILQEMLAPERQLSMLAPYVPRFGGLRGRGRMPARRRRSRSKPKEEAGAPTAAPALDPAAARGNCLRIQEPDVAIYFAYNDANLAKDVKHKEGTMNCFTYDALPYPSEANPLPEPASSGRILVQTPGLGELIRRMP